jgi:hypothetical protein
MFYSTFCMFTTRIRVQIKYDGNPWAKCLCFTIAHTVLEDICDKPIRIKSYFAVARLHGV